MRETNNKINDQVVWQMEQHGCEIDQIFPNEKHIFSYISWHESLEKKSEVPECELYLRIYNWASKLCFRAPFSLDEILTIIKNILTLWSAA